MNLIEYITRRKLNPNVVVNALQDAGVISDNCIGLEDIAKEDHAAAIKHLECIWPNKP